jgi:hypothetical protein
MRTLPRLQFRMRTRLKDKRLQSHLSRLSIIHNRLAIQIQRSRGLSHSCRRPHPPRLISSLLLLVAVSPKDGAPLLPDTGSHHKPCLVMDGVRIRHYATIYSHNAAAELVTTAPDDTVMAQLRSHDLSRVCHGIRTPRDV